MERLQDFWVLVVEVWEHGYLGVDVGRVLVAIAIFCGFLVLRRLFTYLVIGRIKRWVGKTTTEIDDRALGAVENPIRFIPVVMGAFFATQYLELTGLSQTIADNLIPVLSDQNLCAQSRIPMDMIAQG